MRFLVWTCRVIIAIVIGCFVAIAYYQTHTVVVAEGAKAALNWVTVAGAALVGLAWPLMRRYWQALLLLVGLGAFKTLFGTYPTLPYLRTELLTGFQSAYLWVAIGVTFVALVGMIVGRAIVSDRNMQAMKRATSTVTTGQDVAVETAAALQEAPATTEIRPVAAEPVPEAKSDGPETGTPAEEAPPVPEETPAAEAPPKKK